jgi:N-acetylneuraminic acid mutarotase
MLRKSTTANSNVFDIPDTETLPEIIPNTEPADDDYQQANAENYVATMQPMNTARNGLRTVVLNGDIYAIGGRTSITHGWSKVVEIYDTQTDLWTTVDNMNTARCNFGAVVYDGKIYVIGGSTSTDTFTNTMESYDPATDSWTTLMSYMPSGAGKTCFSVTLIPGTDSLYIIGGYSF